MGVQATAPADYERIQAGLPFVEALARRMAASMPHSIDLGDLVQDGVIGLIDAAHRFDEGRGIKFETFAERRIRGAMIDALRRDAWPRGVRRQRRELEAAREALRQELGYEPSLADLAARVGSDEKRLGRTIVRINTIESTSPLAIGDNVDESSLPPALVPSEPDQPDVAYEKAEIRDRIRAAVEGLPPRERKVIGLYYYGEVTMKQIGAEIGVNESRVSQLHARALRRLRTALTDVAPADAVPVLRSTILAFFQEKPRMAKATLPRERAADGTTVPGVVVPYVNTSRAAFSKSPSRNGLASQRHPLSSRNRSASVPATSPVTKITRRDSAESAAAIAR
jgi:RNA polymerase sigma factor FliA